MSSKNKINFTVSSLNLEDVSSTVNLHCQVFPDYFLTHMGQDFLKRFYREFVTYPGYGLVAKYNGQTIGFVTGTTKPDSFYNQFYRRNFGPLIMLVIIRFLSNSHVRQNIWSRFVHLRRALLALFPYSQKASQVANHEDPLASRKAHLLSIGVAEVYRGYGVAEALTDRFCVELKQIGIQIVYLSVFPDNKRAIHFYEKNGWQLIESGTSSLLFSKQLVS